MAVRLARQQQDRFSKTTAQAAISLPDADVLLLVASYPHVGLHRQHHRWNLQQHSNIVQEQSEEKHFARTKCKLEIKMFSPKEKGGSDSLLL